MIFSNETRKLLEIALAEDIGPGDITSLALLNPTERAEAFFLAKSPAVVCGNEIAKEIFHLLDPSSHYEILVPDGARVEKGDKIANVSGTLIALLSGERTALNFMQRLSGIASKVSELVALAGPQVKLLDTRKTTPGLRQLEKYAVATGGGTNHRTGLYDMVLIKNNHIDALGGDVALSVRKAREKTPKGIRVEVEVRNEVELRAALAAEPDIILLDNMTPEEVRRSVSIARGVSERIQLEASGGINEENLKDYATTGVDFISLGMLTHSVTSADISLRIVREPTRS